ncbi:MAG: proline dehydrogenase family protein [Anaerolineales bacterium]|nr:proline dehydrogenase family protein [Anaerolineales bacterium]
MLRLILNYLSQASWARQVVERWGFAKKTAARFVAGETLDEAIRVVKELHSRGIRTTLDHLGENVNSREGAIQAAEEILGIIDRLTKESVPSGVSIKLSQIGLILNQELCENNLLHILKSACNNQIFLRIDMEDSQLTQATLDTFSKISGRGYKDFTGIVIQSSLYRSERDVEALLAADHKIRICKGAYKESRRVAYPKKRAVDENFDRITKLLLKKSHETGSLVSPDGGIPPIAAIATHDQARIEFAVTAGNQIGLNKKGLEFQMLYGIREDLQESLVSQGYPVRVYVPYGKEWYPYFVRRLAERPANLWFFISNLFRR